MPRTLSATLFYSLDGIASDPHLFQYDHFDADLAELMGEAIAQIDTCLLGRVTYEQWSQYWPQNTGGEDAPFAAFINAVPKYVASSTLSASDITWHNAQLLDAPLPAAVQRLKEKEGGRIAVQGSLSVVRQCVDAGLLDELTLIIHPVVAGSGTPLFDATRPARFDLANARTTASGNIVATFTPRAERA